MKAMPANKLDPKVKNVWRLNDGIWVTLCALIVIVPLAVVRGEVGAQGGSQTGLLTVLLVIAIAAYLVLMALFLLVLPPIRYARWRYELTDDYLDIARGIIWRRRYTIPFIRVQNTDTRQGPVLRLFGLASVTVSTAAEEHEIPGLAMDEADQLRDRAAELARIAREDV